MIEKILNKYFWNKFKRYVVELPYCIDFRFEENDNKARLYARSINGKLETTIRIYTFDINKSLYYLLNLKEMQEYIVEELKKLEIRNTNE